MTDEVKQEPHKHEDGWNLDLQGNYGAGGRKPGEGEVSSGEKGND